MKNYYTIAIVILVLLAVFLGGLIIFQKKNQVSRQQELLQSDLPAGNGPRETADIPEDTSQKEFIISVGENTKLFGIASDNPYYGEPPAPVSIGGPGGIEPLGSSTAFEIWGLVISVDPDKKEIRISSDYPRPINTPFAPRGPKVSLQDIREGDRIVASSEYDANGEPDYNNIQFIQITPSVEEIKRLQEEQNQ